MLYWQKRAVVTLANKVLNYARLRQYCHVSCNVYRNMIRRFYYACSLTYRIAMICLIPIFIILKSMSYTREYYSLSFIAVMGTLIVTPLTLTIIHRQAEKKLHRNHKWLQYFAILLVSITFFYQLVLWFILLSDLDMPFGEIEIVVLGIFLVLFITTSVFLFALLMGFPYKSRLFSKSHYS